MSPLGLWVTTVLDEASIVPDRKRQVYQLHSPIDCLNSLVRSRRVLLHGSSRWISSMLVPHQGRDDIRASGRRCAIYVTPRPIVAMFYAFAGGRGISYIEADVVSELSARPHDVSAAFRVSDRRALATTGYVYIVPTSTVVRCEDAYLSYDAIQPLAIVQCFLTQFPYGISERC